MNFVYEKKQKKRESKWWLANKRINKNLKAKQKEIKPIK